MKHYDAENIRNIALVSHSGAGKTSLAEALMFVAGASKRLGKVDDGNTISDFNKDEIERKISINSSLMHLEWKKNKINIIDNPGYIDFIGEVHGALKVSENAIVIINGVSGIEVGTELVWDMVNQYKNSTIFFINQLDKEHTRFDEIIGQLKERFHHNIIPLQFPINAGPGFNAIVDLISMKALYFDSDSGKIEIKDIPADLQSKAEEMRAELIDSAAEVDDEIMEKYLESGELSDEEMKKAIKIGIKNQALFPVFCGSSTSLVGISSLLDVVIDALPSPADVKEISLINNESKETETVAIGPDKDTILFVFKTLSEQHVGELSFFKVISGSTSNGQELVNRTTDSPERVGQIFFMRGKERSEVDKVSFGDIGALVKLKKTHTNNTLTEKKINYLVPPIDFPEPKIRAAVKALNQGDEEKIAAGFSKLHEEDPTFFSTVDTELKQTIVFGQGELQLEIICNRLKERFGVGVELIRPKIPYRETIKKKSEARYKYKKQSGGRGQYGDVNIVIEPLSRGGGFEFVDAIVGGVIPGKYIPAVEKGIRETMEEGILAGYKIVDLKVTLNDGSYHSVDSSDLAFKIAASMALKKAFESANPTLLEPIYEIEVTVPEEYMGDVMGDISARRGKIQGMNAKGHFQVIKALVPLAELYRYSTSLRSMTQGRGLHTQKFSHYEEVPHDVIQKIIEEAKREKEEINK